MKAVLRDSTVTLCLLVLALLFCAGSAFAQTQSAPPRPARPLPTGPLRDPDAPPLTTLEEELAAKRAIKLAEKEHQENLNRAREIGEIGKELRERFKSKSSVDREWLKKLERLEKLTKKVRGDAGGQDEEVNITNRPSDLASAITQVTEVSECFSKDVQNTPRQVVSASVIGSANVLLELIKILREFAR